MVGIELLQLQVELYKSAPSGSHSYTFMLVMIALLIGEAAKCPDDSLGSLKSSFIFLGEDNAFLCDISSDAVKQAGLIDVPFEIKLFFVKKYFRDKHL